MVEADFLRFYQVDLRRLNRMPLRRVVALLKGLPPDASVWLSVRAEQPAEPPPTRPKARVVSLAELGAFFGGHGAAHKPL